LAGELIWNNELLIGIDEIDQQHKDAVDSVNALYNSIRDKKSKDEVIKLIVKLDFYVKRHFKIEENYMELYNYEKMNEHKKAHKFFKDTYRQIRCSYFYLNKQNVPKDNVVSIYALLLAQTLKDWLIFHLQTYDKDFADFILEKLNKKDE